MNFFPFFCMLSARITSFASALRSSAVIVCGSGSGDICTEGAGFSAGRYLRIFVSSVVRTASVQSCTGISFMPFPEYVAYRLVSPPMYSSTWSPEFF